MSDETEVTQQAPTPAPERPDWQQRVHDEAAAVAEKYHKLLAFIRDKGHTVVEKELQLLKDQAEAMHKYLTVLRALISNWL